MCEVERKYLDVSDGLCLPTVVLSDFTSMHDLASMADWCSTAAHYAMRGIRMVTDEAVYDRVVPFYGDDAVISDVASTASTDSSSDVPEILEAEPSVAAGWTSLVLPEHHSDVLSLLGDDVDLGGLSSVPLSWLDSDRIARTSVVVADNAVVLVGCGDTLAGKLKFSTLLAALRGIPRSDSSSLLTVVSTFSRARIRATADYVVECEEVERDRDDAQPGTCARLLLKSDYRLGCPPWTTFRSLLLMPVGALSPAVSSYSVIRTGGGRWHVTRTIVDGMNALCVLAEVSSLFHEWPEGTIGAGLHAAPSVTVRCAAALDDRLGGGTEDTLRVWLGGLLGREHLYPDADLHVVTRAKALLGASQKSRLAMLAAAGDSVITLALASDNATAGKDAQEHQRLRSIVTTNGALARVHSTEFPPGCLSVPAGVDLASSKASADALEACVGMVFFAAGYTDAAVFVQKLKVFSV